ncbi:hypothetical protein SAMN06265373_102606 [Shimia sagamensis]|uniref:Uncharacterized protein n=1 Tax=Shimia sagamensis TaxID=1566352 RepID=A0ABY1NMT6_9RHOB|nr:hypothetical protein SAMN06265373_102606 [Shimia sagamensis]
MRAVVVKIIAPCHHQIAGMAKVVKQMLVEAFIPHPAIERLHEAILHWLAWCNVVPLNVPVFLPFQDGITGQPGPIVTDHQVWLSTCLGDPILLSCIAEA